MLATAGGLAGCVTTQERNARTVLLNSRTLASERTVRVTRENPAVSVLSVAFVPGGRRAPGAVTVTVHSRASHALSDLPISIGVVRGRHARSPLNARANIDYYDTHVPLIPAASNVSWVLPEVTPEEVAGGRLFAVVGVARAPASTGPSELPRIVTTVAGEPLPDRLPVAVSNDSGVPQYGLQVYATASRRGRVVGAARAAIGELDGGARVTIGMPLTGTTSGATLALYAPPTIFK